MRLSNPISRQSRHRRNCPYCCYYAVTLPELRCTSVYCHREIRAEVRRRNNQGGRLAEDRYPDVNYMYSSLGAQLIKSAQVP